MPISTLDELKKKKQAEKGNAGNGANQYYAGGAGDQGGSGLNVVGNPGGREDDDNPIAQIVSKAREQTAQGVGAGAGDEENALAHVTFFRNGFTVDDGPIRSLEDPENKSFVEDVLQGYCPPELIKDGKPSNIVVKDCRGEDYVAPPPPSYVAFSGEGNSMGGGSVSDFITPGEGSSGPAIVTLKEGEKTFKVRVTYPAGKRETYTFNAHHTCGDLMGLIQASEYVSGKPYKLTNRGTRPPSKITSSDAGTLLKDCKVAGAAVVVSL